uniref:Uncharacterized protein n=1 Tax=Arundo donax TaxID=35708 RepID=A0A0A9G701_ARUDO
MQNKYHPIQTLSINFTMVELILNHQCCVSLRQHYKYKTTKL